MMGSPKTAAGTLIAALIAAGVSFLGLIISKEMKVSEFRQQWIDSLRSEISKLIAHSVAIHGAEIANFSDITSKWSAVREDLIAVNNASANIRLRLNPKETASKELISRIDELESALSPGKTIDRVKINKLHIEIAEHAQILLKNEWNRVRRGEHVFFVSKWLALLFTAGAAGTILFAAVHSIER